MRPGNWTKFDHGLAAAGCQFELCAVVGMNLDRAAYRLVGHANIDIMQHTMLFVEPDFTHQLETDAALQVRGDIGEALALGLDGQIIIIALDEALHGRFHLPN